MAFPKIENNDKVIIRAFLWSAPRAKNLLPIYKNWKYLGDVVFLSFPKPCEGKLNRIKPKLTWPIVKHIQKTTSSSVFFFEYERKRFLCSTRHFEWIHLITLRKWRLQWLSFSMCLKHLYVVLLRVLDGSDFGSWSKWIVTVCLSHILSDMLVRLTRFW